MQQNRDVQKEVSRLVLIMICLSAVVCGIAAASGDFSEVTLQKTSGECAYQRLTCQAQTISPMTVCHQVCDGRHSYKGDLIGLVICECWCNNNVYRPIYVQCMHDAGCRA
jgi:hypothetical protein